jgi:hypothetical protein
MKQTFNVVFTPKELAGMIAEYDNGDGNVECAALLVNFIKMGTEERAKLRHSQLDQQRKMEVFRRTRHERKMRELEEKAAVKVKYDFAPSEEDSAFEKLAIAARKVIFLTFPHAIFLIDFCSYFFLIIHLESSF